MTQWSQCGLKYVFRFPSVSFETNRHLIQPFVGPRWRSSCITLRRVLERSQNTTVCLIFTSNTSLLHILAVFCFRSLLRRSRIWNYWITHAIISPEDTVCELCPSNLRYVKNCKIWIDVIRLVHPFSQLSWWNIHWILWASYWTRFFHTCQLYRLCWSLSFNTTLIVLHYSWGL